MHRNQGLQIADVIMRAAVDVVPYEVLPASRVVHCCNSSLAELHLIICKEMYDVVPCGTGNGPL